MLFVLQYTIYNIQSNVVDVEFLHIFLLKSLIIASPAATIHAHTAHALINLIRDTLLIWPAFGLGTAPTLGHFGGCIFLWKTQRLFWLFWLFRQCWHRWQSRSRRLIRRSGGRRLWGISAGAAAAACMTQCQWQLAVFYLRTCRSLRYFF